MEKIRIGIRVFAGLLGSRIVAAVQRTQDMSVEVGVVVPDRTLETHCDAIIDDCAYPAAREVVDKHYRGFPGVILLQDGAAPEGRLIAPPCIAKGGAGNRYRMGDCIMAGLVPLLYPFRDDAKKFRIHLLTQFDGKEPDYLITERAHAFYLREDLRRKVTGDIGSLFKGQDADVAAVVQIPSLLHYELTVQIELDQWIEGGEVRRRLAEMPRVRVAPSGIVSTYGINLAMSFSNNIPPIIVFKDLIEPWFGRAAQKIRFVAALCYSTAAVLSNLDAIRMLVQDMDPIEAMRQTDRDMGFIP